MTDPALSLADINSRIARAADIAHRKASEVSLIAVSKTHPAQAIEPAAFALLAWRRMRGEPANLPSTTGARRAAVLGQVSLP